MKKPITKVDDLRDLKLRAVGVQADLFSRIGAAVKGVPGNEVVPAMASGILDAAMFLDPVTDYLYGFPDVSKVYMVAQLNGAKGLDLIVNAKLWDEMPLASRNTIAAVCRAKIASMVVESKRIAVDEINEMKRSVKFYKMPNAVINELRRIWGELRKEESAKNPLFAQLFQSMAEYDNGANRPDLSMYGL